MIKALKIENKFFSKYFHGLTLSLASLGPRCSVGQFYISENLIVGGGGDAGWTARVRLSAVLDFLFSTAPTPTLRSTQPPIQWVPGALSSGVKRQGCEADHLHLVPRARKRGPIPSLTVRIHGIVLK
jgi:hypothetical protein